jgi:hypothetical protein
MAMVTAIWAIMAAEAIITDGAEDAVITTAGRGIIIGTTDPNSRGRLGGLLHFYLAIGRGIENQFVPTRVRGCLD